MRRIFGLEMREMHSLLFPHQVVAINEVNIWFGNEKNAKSVFNSPGRGDK
jgi:hypothetical protein